MSTFRWLNRQGVSSSHGFSLQSEDRFHYTYTEGDRTMSIIVELGYHCEIISESSLHQWSSPHESEKLEAAEVERIRGNVVEALQFMGIKAVFT